MPRSYSKDLRERVVAARISGMEVDKIVARFQVGRDCVYRWTSRYIATGKVDALIQGGGKQSKIKDEEKFRQIAEVHAYSTLKQMQAALEEDVSIMAISRMLGKLGITRKKRPMVTLKETK
jgi:transposase